MVHWQSEPGAALRRWAWIQASRRPSLARKASWETAPAFMPSSGATSLGFICSISVYQSTSCQREGRLRNACDVRLRSRASLAACSVVAGSATLSSSSIADSRRARPQAAAVFRMLVKR